MLKNGQSLETYLRINRIIMEFKLLHIVKLENVGIVRINRIIMEFKYGNKSSNVEFGVLN